MEATVKLHLPAPGQDAYEAYLAAADEHDALRQQPGVPLFDRMRAATKQAEAFDKFRVEAGLEGGRDLRDVRKIEAMTALIRDVGEKLRSAYSMVLAANGMGVIEHRPDRISEDEHDACVCLFTDAQIILKAALDKAESL